MAGSLIWGPSLRGLGTSAFAGLDPNSAANRAHIRYALQYAQLRTRASSVLEKHRRGPLGHFTRSGSHSEICRYTNATNADVVPLFKQFTSVTSLIKNLTLFLRSTS